MDHGGIFQQHSSAMSVYANDSDDADADYVLGEKRCTVPERKLLCGQILAILALVSSKLGSGGGGEFRTEHHGSSVRGPLRARAAR